MAREGGEGSASRHHRSLPPGKTWHPLYRRLGGPQSRSGQVRKISPAPGFDPRTVQLVAGRYNDYATRPTKGKKWLYDMIMFSVSVLFPSPHFNFLNSWTVRDIKFPLRCKWNLRSSGILHRVDSYRRFGTTYRFRNLWHLTTNMRCVTSQKNEEITVERLSRIQINQPTRCNNFTRLLLDFYVWLNMFRAPLRPSSGAYYCTWSLWLYRRRVAVKALLVVVWQTTTNNAATATLQR